MDQFIDDIREIRRQKREKEEVILADIVTAIKTDPKGVAELVMKNREDIPFEIATLREGFFIRKEDKEQRMQTIDVIQRRISGGPVPEPKDLEIKELEELLENAIRNHPEEAAKALIVERVENPTPDSRDQQLLDREEDRLAEREVDRFIARAVNVLRAESAGSTIKRILERGENRLVALSEERIARKNELSGTENQTIPGKTEEINLTSNSRTESLKSDALSISKRVEIEFEEQVERLDREINELIAEEIEYYVNMDKRAIYDNRGDSKKKQGEFQNSLANQEEAQEERIEKQISDLNRLGEMLGEIANKALRHDKYALYHGYYDQLVEQVTRQVLDTISLVDEVKAEARKVFVVE